MIKPGPFEPIFKRFLLTHWPAIFLDCYEENSPDARFSRYYKPSKKLKSRLMLGSGIQLNSFHYDQKIEATHSQNLI